MAPMAANKTPLRHNSQLENDQGQMKSLNRRAPPHLTRCSERWVVRIEGGIPYRSRIGNFLGAVGAKATGGRVRCQSAPPTVQPRLRPMGANVRGDGGIVAAKLRAERRMGAQPRYAAEREWRESFNRRASDTRRDVATFLLPGEHS